jgi:hypothetical protein
MIKKNFNKERKNEYKHRFEILIKMKRDGKTRYKVTNLWFDLQGGDTTFLPQLGLQTV